MALKLLQFNTLFAWLVLTKSFILLDFLLLTDRWAEQNVNPALFSQELMANASDLVLDEEVLTIKLKISVNCNLLKMHQVEYIYNLPMDILLEYDSSIMAPFLL